MFSRSLTINESQHQTPMRVEANIRKETHKHTKTEEEEEKQLIL